MIEVVTRLAAHIDIDVIRDKPAQFNVYWFLTFILYILKYYCFSISI